MKITQCILSECIKTTRCNISLKLLIPSLSVEFLKPVLKGGKVLAGKISNSDFNLRNYSHFWLPFDMGRWFNQ